MFVFFSNVGGSLFGFAENTTEGRRSMCRCSESSASPYLFLARCFSHLTGGACVPFLSLAFLYNTLITQLIAMCNALACSFPEQMCITSRPSHALLFFSDKEDYSHASVNGSRRRSYIDGILFVFKKTELIIEIQTSAEKTFIRSS